MKAWKRVLTVVFTSSNGNKLVINPNENSVLGQELTAQGKKIQKRKEFALDIKISKYLSTLKDTCTINIYNLTYDYIIRLSSNKFDTVEVIAGYEASNQFTVFKGGITYVSHSLEDASTTKCIVLCSSLLVAKYNNFRLNLTLNSGINMYGAINYICKAANIPNARIDEQLKDDILTEQISLTDTSANFFDAFTSTRNDLCVNSDSSLGNTVSIFKIGKNQKRVLLNKYNTTLISYPRLTSDGLEISMLCTYGFQAGDIIQIDPTIIDMSASSMREAKSNIGYYLDANSCYIVMSQTMNLQNRGQSFSNTIVAKSYNMYRNILLESNT